MVTLLDIAKNALNKGTYYDSLKIKNNNIINDLQNDHSFFLKDRSETHKSALSAISAISLPGEHPTPFWRNPFPQGTPEAREESLRVIEAAKRGEIG